MDHEDLSLGLMGIDSRQVWHDVGPESARSSGWRRASITSPLYARPDGAEALGVSVPKSRRWAVIGGSGRNGPGARI